jgi:signal peptidase
MPPVDDDEESGKSGDQEETPDGADGRTDADGKGGRITDDPVEAGASGDGEVDGVDDPEGENSPDGVEGENRPDASGGPGVPEEPGGPGVPEEPGGPIGLEESGGPEGSGDGSGGPIGWFLESDHVGATFLREFLGSVLVVLVVGMLLFAISGVWPPMVAVKSGSMEPEMERGDLVFVMDQNRFPPDVSVEGTGIATHRSASDIGYRSFGDHGDVIIYRKDGNQRATPIIHRARFWVDGGENWYDKANESFLNGEDCEAVRNCPAPHAGFITKGDNNGRYDQVSGISEPVKPEWVKGTAELRIPWLGHVRLELSELVASPSPEYLASGSPSYVESGNSGNWTAG